LKGQVAFESLFLFLVIISAGTFVTMLYLQTHVETNLYASLRTELTKQSNDFDELVIINKISFSKTENILEVKTSPDTLSAGDFDTIAIQAVITQHTNLSSTQILFNQ
jgi:hypothetical protein